MKTLRLLCLGALLALFATSAKAFEEKSLLAPDGTLYVVRAGTAAELAIAGNYARPDDSVVEWSSLDQSGGRFLGLLPGTTSSALKHNIDVAYDEPSGSLIVLWTEEAPLLNLLRLGIMQGGQWTVSNLLPNPGFPHARNAHMLLSHPVVHTLDANGGDVFTMRSILSVVWWEESNVSLTRYAPIFLDEDGGTTDIQIYDLPASIGRATTGAVPSDVPAGAYVYPSLSLDGPGGGIVASFADPIGGQHYVVRINFPTDLGTPGPANSTWLRRRVPIVGVVEGGPIARMAPVDSAMQITTFIGSGYRPTLVWRDTTALHYVRYDGKKWSDVNSITLDDQTMPFDRALALVQDMATKN